LLAVYIKRDKKSKMAGGFIDEKDPNYNFRGWRFYLNSYTLRGRFNVRNIKI